MTRNQDAPSRVLVVDDDEALAEMLTLVLGAEGFRTEVCHTGDGVMGVFETFQPDVVLLDRMLPGMDGMDVCSQIRAVSPVPIIMLTAKTAPLDVVEGLDAGADDYMTKPFGNAELVARIRARLRNLRPAVQRIEFGRISVDTAAHRTMLDGQEVALTPLEFDLLVCLLSEPEKVFSREELLREVWGYQHPGDTKLVNVHMTRLRQKIEDDADNPTVIRTVRGVGYQALSPGNEQD